MKKLILLPLILFGCSKPNTIDPIQQSNTLVSTSKKVDIFIIFGSLNSNASVKWNYNPNIDSTYNTNNITNYKITNYTESDSIFIYTNSHNVNQTSNDVTVLVNGIVKEHYAGIGIAKKIYLK